MSIMAFRGTMLAATAASLFLMAGPAFAQADQRTAINILVECSKIDDPTARLACYDNNIPQAANSVPGIVPVPPRGVGGGAGAAVPQGRGPQGFGAESLQVQQERFTPVPSSQREIHPTVASIREREPGVYLVELTDGAQWLFSESVSRAFVLPKPGDEVEIERGAMNGYLMRVGEQRAVGVRRVR